MFPGFDGLMTLSRREGVDIRPTLLRVLTDLYVQAKAHTEVEERQFVELTSRLIDGVDDATRAAVRARLAIYPHTPSAILDQLALRSTATDLPMPVADEIPRAAREMPAPRPPTEAQLRTQQMTMQPKDALDIVEMFFAATAPERALILDSFAETPLRPAPRIPAHRAMQSIAALEMAAFNADVATFTAELAETLFLPAATAARIVDDISGEPLACALKAIGMPPVAYQRVLLFLDATVGSSVDLVYRLSRLYDVLSDRTALIMVAAWRGAMVQATRAKYRPALHDDERHRARPASAARPAVQPGMDVARMRSSGER